jgi:PAS domain S-box-containing protein
MLHAPTPMTLLWGPEGLLFFNDAAGAIIGPRRAEVLGQPVRDSFPAFRPLNDEVLRRCLGGEVLSVRERPFAFPGPEPRTVWFDIDYLPVADDGGRPTGALANIVDVTARVLAERAREESETRLRALVDNLPGAVVYQVDSARDMSDRRFTYVSASAEALLGIPADAALADPMAWFAAVHPDDLPRVAEAERRAAEALALLDVEVRALRPDGAVVLGRVLSRPREAPGGTARADPFMPIRPQPA